MFTLPFTQANAISKNKFDGKIKQQIYEDSFFFSWLKKNKLIVTKGGKKIQVPIRYTKLNQSEAADPRSQFVFMSRDTRTSYELPWRYYRTRTLCHWDEMNENYGDGEIVDIMSDKAQEMKEDIADLLMRDLYATSQGARSFVPLSVIIDSAQTYGDIEVNDAAAWASIEDGSTTKLIGYGPGSISAAVDSATFGKNLPQIHVTTRALKTAFEGMLQPQQRYENKAAAELGFDSCSFRGKPVVGDAFCTDNYWYGIDTKQFELRIHPKDNMDLSDWFSLEQAGFPKSMARYGTWVGNIICRMRKTSFKYTALNADL